jgi:hypothetical protein
MNRGGGEDEPSCFDDACVPARVASDAQLRAARLDMRALWMLSFIDGRSLLGDVLARAGLPVDQARQGVSDLVLQGIVALRASAREGAWSSRKT